jgi:hypothetical protein
VDPTQGFQGVVSQGGKLNFIRGLQIFHTTGGGGAALPGGFFPAAALHGLAQEDSVSSSSSAAVPVLPLQAAGTTSDGSALRRSRDKGTMSTEAIDSLFADGGSDLLQQSLPSGHRSLHLRLHPGIDR